MSRTLVGFCLAWAIAGFGGSGKESLEEALKYIGGARRMTPEEAEKIGQMSEVDRLSAALPHLREALGQASTEEETRTVGRMLGNTLNSMAVRTAEQGDYRSAIEHGEEALKHLEANWVLQQNIAQYYVRTGDWAGAAQALTRARELAPAQEQKTSIARQLVAVHMKHGEAGGRHAFDEAIGVIESVPGYTEDATLMAELGHLHNLKGDGEKALEAWEKARQMGALQPGFEERYQRLKAATQIKQERGFMRTDLHHFVLEFDDKTHARLADRFMSFLEEAWSEVGAKFSIYPEQRVFVTIFLSDDYDQAVRVPWSAGAASDNKFDVRVRPGLPDQQYEDTLLHEYTHLVVHRKANQRPVPTWLNEGLAMHSERHLDLVPYTQILARVIKEKNKYLPFDRISAGFTSLPSVKHVRLAYAQGYDVTHKLIERFGFHSVIKMLELIGAGRDFPDAFHGATGVRWPDYEQEWFTGLGGTPGPGFEAIERPPVPGGPGGGGGPVDR